MKTLQLGGFLVRFNEQLQRDFLREIETQINQILAERDGVVDAFTKRLTEAEITIKSLQTQITKEAS